MLFKNKWKRIYEHNPPEGHEVLVFRIDTKKKAIYKLVRKKLDLTEMPEKIWVSQWGHRQKVNERDLWFPVDCVHIQEIY